MQRIAFVGLGNMGEPMVTNLLNNKFPVTVFDMRPEPVERLKELGAESASSPAEAVRNCDIAILSLPSSVQVEAVLTGSGGMAEALPAGTTVVDCSTSNPKSTRALAKTLDAKGVGFVDAGLTGGVAGAKNGKLVYLVGGKEADFERVKPVLEAMGQTFFYMGGVGTGHETKNLSNALSYGTVALVGEILMLGKELGLDLDKLYEALMSGATSKALQSFGPGIISRKYDPVRVSVENVRLHLGMTEDICPDGAKLSILEVAQKLYDDLAGQGFQKEDMAAIAELWPKH